MAKSFQRHALFSCELGLENDDHDDNNDKNVDIKIGSLDDFEVLVFFGISENVFKEHNGRIDGRFITCLWLRPAVVIVCMFMLIFKNKQIANVFLKQIPINFKFSLLGS